ncbi:MAG: HEAT repeat domain-containing protein [Parachlamydiaceae bacterium]
MGLSKIIFCAALAITAFASAEDQGAGVTSMAPNHILYLMHAGETEKALQAYRVHRDANQGNDFELIEQMGLILLDQGFRTKDPEIQLMTIFGAGISMNEKALYIIEEALTEPHPELQSIALNFLTRYHNDRADRAIHRAMRSDYLIIRLETAFQLAIKKDPKAVSQTEALMAKVPEEVWPIFPQIFAESGTPEAKKVLRKLLTHCDELIRIAVILSIAEHNHDDFLPHIRRMTLQHGPSQQEACATALGTLKDESSVDRLQQLARSPHTNVRLAALHSLYLLGRHEVVNDIILIAKNGDPFATALLAEMPGSQDSLAELMQHANLHSRVNAAVALLELRDRRCLPIILSLLIRNTHDVALGKIASQGKSLMALKAIPSAQQNFEDNPIALELSLHLREAILAKSVELSENDFLTLASGVLEAQQNDLIPALVEVLENHPTPGVIAFLKKYQQKIGAPLIRNYCNLALYRMKQPGPYADNLETWVTQQRNVDLIRFRPLVPIDARAMSDALFELTAQETSRLLVEAFESFVANQDDKGIDVLISVIQSGNKKNKYALIGLLMRAIQ